MAARLPAAPAARFLAAMAARLPAAILLLAAVMALTETNALAAATHPRAAAATHPRAAAGSSHRRAEAGSARKHATIGAILAKLAQSGSIPTSAYESYLTVYSQSRRSLRKLSGTRKVELGNVLGNLEAMAAKGLFTPSRLPIAFLTLERNREWWTTRSLLASGQRVGFPPSRLVWEYYPGQGIEVQWLATFGAANGYYLSHQSAALEELLDEAIALATQRGGGIAWEYMFGFDGGSPPWTSGLSQGTALQALARAWSRTHQARYLMAAQQALGIFRGAPPVGVRVQTAIGAHYLEYTYAPGERIVNGFVQALVGLYEYAKLTGDPEGQALFEAGDAQARFELPRFDTGAWSMYDQHSESDLNYHELLLEFLEHLCERTARGEPLTPTAGQIPGDEVYCATARRFEEDLTTPPTIELLTQTARTGERVGVEVKLSKVSTVSMTVSLDAKTVWSNRATIEGGRPRLLWVTPSKPGEYEVALKAVDLAGNEEVTTGTIRVKRAPKRHGRKAAMSAWAPSSRRMSPAARRLPAL